jgi:hypothetical protein
MVASVLAGSDGMTDFCAARDWHSLGKCSHENLIRLLLFSGDITKLFHIAGNTRLRSRWKVIRLRECGSRGALTTIWLFSILDRVILKMGILSNFNANREAVIDPVCLILYRIKIYFHFAKGKPPAVRD